MFQFENYSSNDSFLTIVNKSNVAVVQSGGNVLTSKPFVIIKSVILLLAVFVNFAGNTLTIEAIRSTPKLRTFSNLLIASFTLSDMLVGLSIIFYVYWNLELYVLGGTPCSLRIILIIAPLIQQIPAYVANFHVALLSVDR